MVFCGSISVVAATPSYVTPANVCCILCLFPVNAPLYKFDYETLPQPRPPSMLQSESAKGKHYVSQFKSSNYIYSYKSHVMKLQVFYNFYIFDARSVYKETEASP